MAGDVIRPTYFGRFNYLTVKDDLYDVYFRSNIGNTYTVIAKGLSQSAAIELMEYLNKSITRSVYRNDGHYLNDDVTVSDNRGRGDDFDAD